MKNIFTHKRERDSAYKASKNILVQDTMNRTARLGAL